MKPKCEYWDTLNIQNSLWESFYWDLIARIAYFVFSEGLVSRIYRHFRDTNFFTDILYCNEITPVFIFTKEESGLRFNHFLAIFLIFFSYYINAPFNFCDTHPPPGNPLGQKQKDKNWMQFPPRSKYFKVFLGISTYFLVLFLGWGWCQMPCIPWGRLRFSVMACAYRKS